MADKAAQHFGAIPPDPHQIHSFPIPSNCA
jgi:hypothetical protein